MQLSKEHFKETFQQYDKDGDGFVDKSKGEMPEGGL